MKNLILILFFGVLIFNCKKSETIQTDISEMVQDSTVENLGRDPQKSDAEILQEQADAENESSKIVNKFTEKRTANGFVYKLYCEEEKSGMINFQVIEVFKNNKLIQKIKVDSVLVYHRNEVLFEVDKDVNFDGKNDIQLVNWVGMHDATYNFYLYSKSSDKYVHFPQLSKIRNIEIDKENKMISSAYHDGPTDNSFDNYIWKKGKLVLITGSYVDEITNERKYFHTKNGKIVND